MKKIMILLFCTFLSISLAACGAKHQTEGLKTDPAAGETAAVDSLFRQMKPRRTAARLLLICSIHPKSI